MVMRCFSASLSFWSATACETVLVANTVGLVTLWICFRIAMLAADCWGTNSCFVCCQQLRHQRAIERDPYSVVSDSHSVVKLGRPNTHFTVRLQWPTWMLVALYYGAISPFREKTERLLSVRSNQLSVTIVRQAATMSTLSCKLILSQPNLFRFI